MTHIDHNARHKRFHTAHDVVRMPGFRDGIADYRDGKPMREGAPEWTQSYREKVNFQFTYERGRLLSAIEGDKIGRSNRVLERQLAKAVRMGLIT